MEKIKNKEKRTKGITLIALVITIIVLLILAGVSIAMLTGENGLLNQAQTAKTNTEKLSVEEAVDIAMAEYYTRKKTGEDITLGEFLNEKVESEEFDNVTDNGDGTFTVEKDGYEVIVNEIGRQGEATVTGPRPTVTNVKIVVNSDGTGENLPEGSQIEGTTLYINFVAKIEGGTITSVTCDSGTPNVTNGTYTTEINKNGKYKFTIVGEVEGKEYTKEYLVEVNQYKDSLKVGDYVEYDVTYKDIYSDYNFTAKDGWRVLDPGKENSDGTYTGVKLISTGIPANLYYYSSTIKSLETDEQTLGKWGGNLSQRTNYKQIFYSAANYNTNNENMYAAAGLYYNFGLIKFTQYDGISEKNEAEYKEINGKVDEILSGNEFKIDGVAEKVHCLTMDELNKSRGETSQSTVGTNEKDGAIGLFYLRELKKYEYDSSKNPIYWLASPYSDAPYYLRNINSNGTFGYNFSNTLGVRPVISLNSNIEIKKINDDA